MISIVLLRIPPYNKSQISFLALQTTKKRQNVKFYRFFFLSICKNASLPVGCSLGKSRVSKGSAGFLGRAQIDDQTFFAYTESKSMQRRRGL